MYLLAYMDDEEEVDIIKNMGEARYLYNLQSDFFHLYFMEFNDTSITLSTFDMHHRSNCSEMNRIVVNQFSIETQTWQHGNFTVEKFKDFEQCEIVFGAIMEQKLALEVMFNNTKTTQGVPVDYQGYATKLNAAIAQKLNFKIFYNPVFLVRAAIDEEHIYTLDKLWYLDAYPVVRCEMTSLRKLSYQGKGDAVATFNKIDHVILISRFSAYTILEKVFLPFEPEVWWWLIGSLVVIGGVSAVIVVFASPTVRMFVFGFQVSTPVLNLM
jgi:hypothetical protein